MLGRFFKFEKQIVVFKMQAFIEIKLSPASTFCQLFNFQLVQKSVLLAGTKFWSCSIIFDISIPVTKQNVGTFLQIWKCSSRFQTINIYWNKANTCLDILPTFQFPTFSKKCFFGRHNILIMLYYIRSWYTCNKKKCLDVSSVLNFF